MIGVRKVAIFADVQFCENTVSRKCEYGKSQVIRKSLVMSQRLGRFQKTKITAAHILFHLE